MVSKSSFTARLSQVTVRQICLRVVFVAFFAGFAFKLSESIGITVVTALWALVIAAAPLLAKPKAAMDRAGGNDEDYREDEPLHGHTVPWPGDCTTTVITMTSKE